MLFTSVPTGFVPTRERKELLTCARRSGATAATLATTSLSMSLPTLRAWARAAPSRGEPPRRTSTRFAAHSVATAFLTATSGQPNSFLVKCARRLAVPSPPTVTVDAEPTRPIQLSTVSAYSGRGRSSIDWTGMQLLYTSVSV